jgi:hypothetical protein
MSNLCVTVTHVMTTTSKSPSSESWQKGLKLLNSQQEEVRMEERLIKSFVD